MTEKLRLDVVDSCRNCKHLGKYKGGDICSIGHMSSKHISRTGSWGGDVMNVPVGEVHKNCPLPKFPLRSSALPVKTPDGVFLVERPLTKERADFVNFASEFWGFKLQGRKTHPHIVIPLQNGSVRLSADSIYHIKGSTALFEAQNTKFEINVSYRELRELRLQDGNKVWMPLIIAREKKLL